MIAGTQRFELRSLRQRLLLGVVVPFGLWLFLGAVFLIAEPIPALECERASVGGPVACRAIETRALLHHSVRAFALDGARLDNESVRTHSRRGGYSVTRLVVTTADGERVALRMHAAPVEAELRRILVDPSVLAIRRVDPAPWGFLLAALPVSIALISFPLAMLGGRLDVRITPERVEVTRVRAWIRGTPTMLDRSTAIDLRVRRFRRGRRGEVAALVAVQGERETVLAHEAPPEPIERIAAHLRTALSATPPARPTA